MTHHHHEANLLIGPRLFRLAHQFLHTFQAAHLFLDRLQDIRPLLQPKKDILLHERKLYPARQLLQLLQLRVRLRQQRLLVFLAAKSEEGAATVVTRETFFRNRGFAVCKDGYPLLILMELVALVF